MIAFSIECELDRNVVKDRRFRIEQCGENAGLGRINYVRLVNGNKSCIVFENCGMNGRRTLPECAVPVFSILERNKIDNFVLMGFAGATRKKYGIGSFLIPSDFVDFTKTRSRSYLELKSPGKIFFYRMAEPYSPLLSVKLNEHARKFVKRVFNNVKYAVTEGPRFESAAEIKAIKNAGCDAVCLSGAPDVYFSRELGINFGVGLFISNLAEGVGEISNEEILGRAKFDGAKITEIICSMASDETLSTKLPYYGDKYWMQKP